MIKRSRILVVDDDARVRSILREAFGAEGFDVSEAGNARSALELYASRGADVVALDLGLPDGNGLNTAKQLRAGSDVPIVIITARGDPVDTVLGLEFGADDYIRKPFHIREVVARVKAVMRRREAAIERATRALAPQQVVEFDDWRLHLGRRELVDRDGVESPLTSSEFDLLKLFVTSPGAVLSRDWLMDQLKGRSWSPYDRGIDMQVRRLRNKIEIDPARPRIIKTVRGTGYMFSASVKVAGADAPSDADFGR